MGCGGRDAWSATGARRRLGRWSGLTPLADEPGPVSPFSFQSVVRACDFPAHGLATVFLTWLRSLRAADSAHELVRALVMELGLGPA
jgi:hypothetical protein